jgi:hypothetical protein
VRRRTRERAFAAEGLVWQVREEKRFFFVKKNQKTFVNLDRAGETAPGPDSKKFFCFFLFTKRSACLNLQLPFATYAYMILR